MNTLTLPPVNWRLVGAGAACAVSLPMLVLLAIDGQVRIPIAAALLFPMLALAAVNVRGAILAVLVFLILLGDIRRALIPIAGWSGMDPLLLIGPAFAILVTAAALGSGTVRLDTPLARWAAGLMAVMTLQIFNPLQGGLAVGVAGVIFLMAPVFWFWVGRTYATESFVKRLLFGIVIPFGIAAMVFGFYQRFLGYLPYQMTWYRIAGYEALGRPETGLAPISFFASGTEHGAFLVTAGVLLWAAFLKKNRAAALLILPILAAVILTGSRGPVVKLIATMAIMWAVTGASKKTWLPRFALAIAVLGVGLMWSLTQAATLGLDADVQRNLSRQTRLFSGSELETPERSTLVVHSTLLMHGYQAAMSRPLGHGLGATSSAASKFGPSQMQLGTETDVGDVMVATGLVGGVIYHAIIVLFVLTAVRYWRNTKSVLALALLGLLSAHFLLWLGGGLYAVSAIVWFCIGSLDGLERDRAESAAMVSATT